MGTLKRMLFGFQEMFAISFAFELPNFKGCFLDAVSFDGTAEGLFLSSRCSQFLAWPQRVINRAVTQ